LKITINEVLKLFIGKIFILLILVSATLFSVSPELKKMESALPSQSGMKRIRTLVFLTDKYCGEDPKKAIELGTEALSLLDPASAENLRSSIFYSLGMAYASIGEYGKSLEYCNKCLKISKETGDKKRKAQSLNLIGIVNIYKSKYSDSLPFLFESLALFKNLGEKKEIASTLNSIGIVYDMSGDYESALDYYYKSLKVKEEIGELRFIASSLNNIGVIYNLTNFPKKALDNFKRALKINRKLKRKKSIAITLTNIGNIHLKEKEYKNALKFYHEALVIDKEINNQRGIGSLYNNIGLSLSGMGRFDEAISKYRESMVIRQKLGDERLIIRTLLNIVRIKIKGRSVKATVTQLIDILKRAERINMKSEAASASKFLFEIYEENKNIKKAFFYLKKYESLNKDLLNNRSREKVIEIEKKFQLKNKEKEIELLKKDKLIEKINTKRQRFTKNVFLVGAFVLFLGVIMLLYLYKGKTSINKELKKVNIKLDRSARTDPLTGLPNRRDIYEKIIYEQKRISRVGKMFSLVLCDIDDFKFFNDNYGHDCGDYVLIELSALFGSLLREQDSIGRWGGEEFLILLPQTTRDGAVILSDKIRENISSGDFVFNGEKLSVTLTFGICSYSEGMTVSECLKKADDALYRGKRGGKNRVEI